METGEGVTSVVPIFEGFPLQHAQQRIDLAGQDLTDFLAARLAERGHGFAEGGRQGGWGMSTVRDIKVRR